MTEIMPFPENNILFYWAAPQGGLFLRLIWDIIVTETVASYHVLRL